MIQGDRSSNSRVSSSFFSSPFQMSIILGFGFSFHFSCCDVTSETQSYHYQHLISDSRSKSSTSSRQTFSSSTHFTIFLSLAFWSLSGCFITSSLNVVSHSSNFLSLSRYPYSKFRRCTIITSFILYDLHYDVSSYHLFPSPTHSIPTFSPLMHHNTSRRLPLTF